MIKTSSVNHLVDQLVSKSAEPFSVATSYYLLISNDGCQTTWHTDFSSTSVFYTVLTGSKTFFLVAPTEDNMSCSMPGPNKNATTCKLNFFTKEFQLLRSSIFVFFCIILHHGPSFPYVFSMYLRNFQLSMHYIVFANSFRFRPTFFGCHKRLEGGCLRVTLNPGDVFAMPSQYIHTVLTSGSRDEFPFRRSFEPDHEGDHSRRLRQGA